MTEANSAKPKERVNKSRTKPVSGGESARKVPTYARTGLTTIWGDGQVSAGSRLQRACSCGRHTIGGGECLSCRQKGTSGAAGLSDERVHGGESSAPSVWGFQGAGHDFSQVKTQTLMRSEDQEIAGEGGNDEDTEALIGGERGRAPVGLSVPSGNLLQRDGEGNVILSHSVVTAPKSLGCGGFRDQVRWGLVGGGASTNDFVVQKVTFDLQREKCDGSGDSNLQTTYWEAWEVRSGNIYIGTSGSRHNADTFQVPPAPEHKGSCYEAGWAKFIPDYEAPRSWGNVPQARALPSTTSEPVGWSNSGTIHRYMRSTFDCCNQTDPGDFESGGQSNG